MRTCRWRSSVVAARTSSRCLRRVISCTRLACRRPRSGGLIAGTPGRRRVAPPAPAPRRRRTDLVTPPLDRAGSTRTRRSGDPTPHGTRSTSSRPQLAGRQPEHRPHRVVERADAREARGVGDVAHGHRCGLDQQACRGGALGAREGERAGPQLGEHLAFELPHAVPQPRGQPGHAFAVDDPVGDQAHGAGDDVGAFVPLRRPRGGVRTAPLARAEPGRLRGRRAGVEAHVLDLRRHDRAARAAVDAGGHDSRVEPPVEAGVLGLHGADAAFGVLIHARQCARRHRQEPREKTTSP